MILIACVDDNLGLLFNGRRQSLDRVVRGRILQLAAGHKLWMNEYSRSQFEEGGEITVAADFMRQAGEGDYCFAENVDIAPYAGQVSKIILYRWNRVYPADVYFDIPLAGWQLAQSTDFAGYSHENITEEIYIK